MFVTADKTLLVFNVLGKEYIIREWLNEFLLIGHIQIDKLKPSLNLFQSLFSHVKNNHYSDSSSIDEFYQFLKFVWIRTHSVSSLMFDSFLFCVVFVRFSNIAVCIYKYFGVFFCIIVSIISPYHTLLFIHSTTGYLGNFNCGAITNTAAWTF